MAKELIDYKVSKLGKAPVLNEQMVQGFSLNVVNVFFAIALVLFDDGRFDDNVM